MDGLRWTIMDLTFPTHFFRTNMDELQMHTKAPDADNLKSQVANTQRSQSLWKQSAITTVPHVIGIFLLTLSPCPILKASDAINHANDLPTCRAGGKASQLHKSKSRKTRAWCEVNLCPLTTQEDDREVPQRGEMSPCPHN